MKERQSLEKRKMIDRSESMLQTLGEMACRGKRGSKKGRESKRKHIEIAM